MKKVPQFRTLTCNLLGKGHWWWHITLQKKQQLEKHLFGWDCFNLWWNIKGNKQGLNFPAASEPFLPQVYHRSPTPSDIRSVVAEGKYGFHNAYGADCAPWITALIFIVSR